MTQKIFLKYIKNTLANKLMIPYQYSVSNFSLF